MQHALNPLMRMSDNAAFGRTHAPKVLRQPLAVHAVHVVGTHTPLLSNAKEGTTESCNRHATPARATCIKSGTWRRGPVGASDYSGTTLYSTGPARFHPGWLGASAGVAEALVTTGGG
jgi:hypothetical protein